MTITAIQFISPWCSEQTSGLLLSRQKIGKRDNSIEDS